MNVELELKFMLCKDIEDELNTLLSKNCFKLLKKEELQLSNRYFDTKDRLLFNNGIALRVRTSNEKPEMTIKTKDRGVGGIFVHPEYNISLNTEPNIPDLSLFPTEIFTNLDVVNINKNIYENMAQNCNRTIYLISYLDSIIEISYDKVTYLSSNQNIEDLELELELKEGTKDSLVKIAFYLLDSLSNKSLYLGTLSKMQRAAIYASLAKVPDLIENLELSLDVDSVMRAFENNELVFLLEPKEKSFSVYLKTLEFLINKIKEDSDIECCDFIKYSENLLFIMKNETINDLIALTKKLKMNISDKYYQKSRLEFLLRR